MSNITYTLVAANDATVEFTRATKSTVVAEAERLLKAHEQKHVVIFTSKGNVVFERKINLRFVTSYPPRLTKTVEVSDEYRSLLPEGYVPAYSRPRAGTGFARNNDVEKSIRYAVLNVAKREIMGFAATARQAEAMIKGVNAEA